ncbi:hypothetical protein [Photobacterium halotolerans]|uniref:Uncharacterized protein n=1 Tax=Photobacterium halotolerans TaxID=265726 RepID=A0A7X5ART1_9GAMM|nr:hypothetical protein [Photobacterium halotolerans]NAW64638.1 hypothetical protein [Photobacterium halotolerans]
MSTAIFFNSQYFGRKYEDRLSAALSFSSLVQGLRLAVKSGAKDILASSTNALDVEIANNYTVRDWINDRGELDEGERIDRDEQRYFARRIDKTPFFEEAEFVKCDEYLECEVEICIDDKYVKNDAVTLALINSGILLSPPLAVFNSPFIKCKAIEIEGEYDDMIRCIFDKDSIIEHLEHIQAKAGILIEQSKDLWLYREQLFPSIEFCARVEGQLQAINHFGVIFSRLCELEKYSSKWSEGAFIPDSIPSKVSGESESVRTDTKAIESRTFKCPDGEKRTFFWHLRATPGAIRIHFFPDEKDKKIIIGHIGEKLFYR